MSRILIFICLFFTQVGHGSKFTQEDLREILAIKRNYTSFCNNDQRYPKIFGNPRIIDPGHMLSFRLKSGADVMIAHNVIMNLKEEHLVTQANSVPGTLFKPALSEEFQDFSLPAEFVNDPNIPSTLKMCKKYGMICNDKFKGDDITAIKLVLLQVGATAIIKDGHFSISACEASLTQTNCLKRLLLAPDTVDFNMGCEIKMNFRHLSPNNEESNYVLFLHTKNTYIGDLGQEDLIGSFTGTNTGKSM